MVSYFDPMKHSESGAVSMKGVRRRVFLRSFLIEIMWNYPHMQNIGFTFCLLPALDRIITDERRRKEVTLRQIESGNTNPVFAPMCIGAISRVEEGQSPPNSVQIKKRLMSTLAAQGDRIFWGILRPVSSLISVSVAMLFSSFFLAPFIALLIYNVPNVVIRYAGFPAGWDDGVNVVRRFKSRWVEESVSVFRGLLFFCSGSLTAVALIFAVEHAGAEHVTSLIELVLLLLALFSASFFVLKKSFSQTRIIYPLLILLLLGFSLLREWT